MRSTVDVFGLVRFRESVESCEKWANSTTQQVDLAFNIFFMIYFFIRVGDWWLILCADYGCKKIATTLI